MQIRIISAGDKSLFEVCEKCGIIKIPLEDFHMQSSADGTTELHMKIKYISNEFEITSSLK